MRTATLIFFLASFLCNIYSSRPNYVEVGRLCFTIDYRTNEATVFSCKKSGVDFDYRPWYKGEIVIPSEIRITTEASHPEKRFFPVTIIRPYAFEKHAEITSVVIPNSIKKIGGYAFRGCIGLRQVAIPASVTEIGGGG